MCLIYVARKHFFFNWFGLRALSIAHRWFKPNGRCWSNRIEHNSVNKRSTHKQKLRSVLKSNTHIFKDRPGKLYLFRLWSSFNVYNLPFIRFYRLNFLLYQKQTLKYVMRDNILALLIRLFNIRRKHCLSFLYHQIFQKLQKKSLWRCGPTPPKVSSFTRFLDHT
jgi:hypothetical protein